MLTLAVAANKKNQKNTIHSHCV